jgi:hypothetical protein
VTEPEEEAVQEEPQHASTDESDGPVTRTRRGRQLRVSHSVSIHLAITFYFQ